MIRLNWNNTTSAADLARVSVERLEPRGNLLTNPGFEAGSDAWVIEPGASILHDAARAHSGERCLAFAGADGWVPCAVDPVAVQPGERIHVAGWWAREAADGYGYLLIEWWSGVTYVAAITSAGLSSLEPVTSAWVLDTFSAVVPSGITHARFHFVVDHHSVGTWYADDALLLEDPRLVQVPGNLATDGGLETAVLLSLYTDRRVGDQRGWWGDSLAAAAGHQLGSRLWTLGRASGSSEDRLQARAIILEALQWLVDDGVASDIQAEVLGWEGGTLRFLVSIARPDQLAPRWQRTWEVTLGL